MLYYLHELGTPFHLFHYVTPRAAGAALTSFLAVLIVAPHFIRYLREKGVHENIDKPDSETLHTMSQGKKGTPTMGGLLIVGALCLSTLLWASWGNGYIWLTLAVVLAMAAVGFHDDYVKLTKVDRQGMSGREKLFWQFLIAFAAAAALTWGGDQDWSTVITVPLLKPELFAVRLGALFVLFAAIVIVGSSNAVNLTDGMDGLAAGCSVMVGGTYAGLAYVAGHKVFAAYLQIPYIPGSQELVILCAATVGALLGFLWFNAHPAQVFMGDTGSLPLGGLIGMVALITKQELLLICVGGVFVVEALSVMLQVASFKLWNRRIFRIAPLHHHYQFGGWTETKVVTRFWIVQLFLAITAILTLKIR